MIPVANFQIPRGATFTAPIIARADLWVPARQTADLWVARPVADLWAPARQVAELVWPLAA